MKTITAILKIKQSTHDISDEYSNEACIGFLNNSIQQIASLLIASKWVGLVKELTIMNGNEIPKNYMKSAGQFPVKVTNGKCVLLDDYDSIIFRYFATPDNITGETEDEELPFKHNALDECVVQGAIILARNENEYNISQDTALYTALQTAIANGMGQ